MPENRIQFRLPDEEIARLSELAARSSLSPNELARSLIITALDGHRTLEELREDVLRVQDELAAIRDGQRRILEWFSKIEARPRRS